MTLPRIVVTAAVIEEDSRFLVTQRPRGVHLEGFWEFPGGKCEQGESHTAALQREILEELDVPIIIGRELLSVVHTYTDRIVELHFFASRLAGRPRAVLGQEMKWVTREELRTLPLPPADEELIDILTASQSSD
ncbi:MAG: (deoxy)nucleoside triphosphate pyrophosphohydrolase [Vicinamibacterales bacterium]